jgi:hypothetical protein
MRNRRKALEALMPEETDRSDEDRLIRWITGMYEDAKTRHFTTTHADQCPKSLSLDLYERWARDSLFTARMARQYSEGPEDMNRADFWYDVYKFLMAMANQPID